MGKINVLSREVYNRIAAGEVIDRPYSAVKELVENSLDAGATEIKIYIEKGGKQLIKVVDNGSGIEKSDLKTAFLPHATSKISSADDLEKVKTLGFRGEALASISVIARVELVSVTAGNQACKVTVEDDKVGEIQPAALERGTVITVRDLFYNTPVRAKFLKPDKKEESDITNFVTRFILGNPTVSFRYFIDGKLALQSYGGGLDEALAQVYGAKTLAECYKISAERHGIKVEGFIGNQNFFKPNKTYQSVFLNGRYIINNAIATALSNAYASYAMKRQYPFYVLNVTVPEDMVDVNVHPNKSDVRFTDGNAVFGAVYKIVSSVLDGTSKAADFVVDSTRIPEMRSTLRESDTAPRLYAAENAVAKPPEPEPEKKEEQWYYNPVAEDNLSSFLPAQEIQSLVLGESPHAPDRFDRARREYDESLQRADYESRLIEFEKCKYKGSIFNTYLIFEMGDDVYLIDQHAAHERLLYDNLRANLKKRKIMQQGLIVPYILDVNTQEKLFLSENLQIFEKIGFTVSEFGPSSFRIDAVPVDLADMNVKEFFDEVLKNVDSFKSIKLEDVLKDKLAMTACKHAVKGGQELTELEVDVLFRMLKGDVGLKCPHGRPICVKLSKTQIEKMFKRIVN